MDQNIMQNAPTRRQILTSLGLVGATALAGLTLEKGNSGMAHAAVTNGKIVLLTLTDLRALKNPQADTVYWVTDAGREGLFRVRAGDKTSVDNDGTLIVGREGARFGRLYDGPLNVQWFGATGDGKTDDAPALIKALRAAADDNTVAYIPRTDAAYLIASTVRVPLETGQQLIVESNGATIKPVADIKTDTLWKLSMYDERIYLSFGMTGAGKQVSIDVHTAFENNYGTSVQVRGLVIDGKALPVVASTLKDGQPDWTVKFAVGLQISAENVVIEACRFQNIFGYGTRLHGPASVYIANNSFHEVGGRGNTPHLKVDMDAFGDGVYISSIKGNGQIVVTDCTFQGITTLPHRSRIAITFEYGDKIYNSIVSNCTIVHYAKGIHIEENVPSEIKIDKCLFRNVNFGIANVINNNGRCVVSNSKFLITDIDKFDFGSPLFFLNYQSTCAVFFSNCEIHLNTSGQTWQTIAGAQLFDGCTFYGYNKNHFFADANANFVNCKFNDFGGPAHTFFSYSGGSEYRLENCDFTGDDVHAKGQKVKLSFVNCRHNTPGKQLLGNHMANLGGIFPNINNECSEHILKDKVTKINAETCPSPLWQSVQKLLAIVTESDVPFGRDTRNYKKWNFRLDEKGVWNSEAPERVDAQAKVWRVVLVPAHYEQYL
jgi:hypothetical protein